MIELDLPRSAGGGRKIEVLTMNYKNRDIDLANATDLAEAA